MDDTTEPTLRDDLRAFIDLAERLRGRDPMVPCRCSYYCGSASRPACGQPGCELALARTVMFAAGSVSLESTTEAHRTVRIARAALVERDGWAVGFDPDGSPVWSRGWEVAAMTVRDDPREEGWTYGGVRHGAMVDGGTFVTVVAAMKAAERSVRSGPLSSTPTFPEQVEWSMRLRHARRKRGFTLGSFARAIGIGVADVSRLERAKSRPTEADLANISATLGKI